ncbi:MAG: CmpA/NrtA family ABC transporter substrate-binding protein [Planctomycetota bacterium]
MIAAPSLESLGQPASGTTHPAPTRAGTPTPEKRDLALGLVPLTDCAPIAVGVEKGFFREFGLNVTTTREQSWAGIRDKVAYGLLDGAQMLATMPICATLGVGGFQCDMTVGMTLGLNGNAITLSTALCKAIADAGQPLGPRGANTAEGLATVIRLRQAEGKPPLRLGMVFPMSTHDLELRYWLAVAGIDPDRDVELVVVPPPRMVEALRAGELAGFCVGEPWNSVAVAEGLGQVAMTKHALWNHSMEKVLGVTTTWAERYPNTHFALISALIRAGQWLDLAENREETAHILALPQYVGIEPSRLLPSLCGRYSVSLASRPIEAPSFHVFHRFQANMPWRSQMLWYLEQMVRWGQIDTPYEAQLALGRVVRDDVYRAAAKALGIAVPVDADKSEGAHADAWTMHQPDGELLMGSDLFFDGRMFEPTDVLLSEASPSDSRGRVGGARP